MPQDGRLLEGFVEFLEQAGAPRITAELALAWARLPVDAPPTPLASAALRRPRVRPASRDDRSYKRGSLQGFAAWASPADRPYIYTEEEITALMAVAAKLRPGCAACVMRR